MTRRSLGFTALYAGALLVGTIAGGAVSVPSVYAKSAASASQSEPADQAPVPAATQAGAQATSQSPVHGSAKKAPPVQCKTTKDCPQDHLCTKVSNHKECTPSAIRPPVAPVVT